MNPKEILVVLGAPNSPAGELSDIAISRLDALVNLYSDGKRILCTGGWGDHFNTSTQAHAVYAKKYLLNQGIPEAAFLEHALSANTVEDAVKSKIILSRLDNPSIAIITSDYHLKRVMLVFNEIFKGFDLRFVGVESGFLTAEQQTKLRAHEETATRAIIQNGLYY